MFDESDPTIKVEYVHCSFHSKEVTGLDVCIRKQLIVTCSLDKSIRIWNYVTRTCEILYSTSEECYAVAFHPSGFHLVISTGDKILFMNVLSKSLQQFHTQQSKQCIELRFNHGGHLFAASTQTNGMQVYPFYTRDEPPPNYTCKNHTQKVATIDWFEDDMGLASGSWGGEVY